MRVRPLLHDLESLLLNQRDNYILWMPVFFGFGILAYFQLKSEPPFWLFITLTSSSILLMFCINIFKQQYVKNTFIISIFIISGFVSAQFRTDFVSSPVIEKSSSIIEVVGRVVRVEQRPEGPRVLLDNIKIYNLSASNTPKYIRLTLARNVSLQTGDEIKIKTKLRPPPPPSIVDSYDFQRRAWFESLGAVGFAVGKPEILYNGTNANQSVNMLITDIRKNIVDTITRILPVEIASVSAALITGDRSGITEATQQTMRDSGLAHLLAISGLHMGIVASVLFFSIRAGLALSETLALRFPIKKWAAFGALPGSFVYLLIAGAPVPTQRAFIMTALVLLAIICDRVALSMRLVAFAAFGILFIYPESLFSPSFQMSFAAVVGLIALFDSPLSRSIKTRINGGRFSWLFIYILTLSASSLVATIATMPFSIYHFGRVAEYGIIANLLAVPVMAFWVMPFAILSMVLMPFGLGSIGLIPMGWGVEIILNTAAMVAKWPGSYLLFKNITDIALAGFVISGLWMCLWQGKLRWLLIPLIPLAIAISYFDQKPDILLSSDGKLAAIFHETGQLLLSNNRRNRFESEIWRQRLAVEKTLKWPEAGTGKLHDIICDDFGCVYNIKGRIIAFPKNQLALKEDCEVANILISSLFPINRYYCKGPTVVIDKYDLKEKGGHLIYVEGDGKIIIKTVQDARGQRPWTGDMPN